MRIFVTQTIPEKELYNVKFASAAGNNFCNTLIRNRLFDFSISITPTFYQTNSEHEQGLDYISDRLHFRFLSIVFRNLACAAKIYFGVKRSKVKSIWFYNLTTSNCVAFLLLAIRYRVYLIHADSFSSNFAGVFLSRFASFFKGVIYLSERSFFQSKVKVKIYLPGIVTSNFVEHLSMDSINLNSKDFLFSGTLNESNGIELALQVFSELPGLNLFISGRGPKAVIVKDYQRRFSNIKYLDFLSLTDYKELLKKFTYSLSFRDPRIADNLENFPSKIFEYVFFGKMVITTMSYNLKGIQLQVIPFDKEAIKEHLTRRYLNEDEVIQKIKSNKVGLLSNYSFDNWLKAIETIELVPAH